jgi:hypothetical protein
MRVPIKHDLDKAEVRRRLHERSHEIANFVPGGVADVTTGWPDQDTMTLTVGTMGQRIDGRVLVEDGQVVFEIDLPGMISFVEPMISKAIRSEGQKMLAAPGNS